MKGLRGETWWSEGERRLIEAARSGEPLDMRQAGDPVDLAELGDDPARRIRGEVLAELLAGAYGPLSPKGLLAAGLDIRGPVILTGEKVAVPVVLARCRLDSTLSLDLAEIESLALPGCRSLAEVALSAHRATIRRGLAIDELVTDGGVQLGSVRLSGQLVVTAAQLANPTGPALDLRGAQIDSSVFVDGQATLSGPLTMAGARIGGSVVLSDLLCDPEHGIAVEVSGCEIDGDLDLSHTETNGAVVATGASIGGRVDTVGARLSNLAGGTALDLQRARIGHDLNLGPKLEVTGALIMLGIEVGGDVRLAGASVHATGPDPVIDLRRARLAHDLALSDSSHIVGSVSVSGATVTGSLIGTGGRFDGGEGIAVDAEGLRAGALVWRGVGEVRGIIDLTGAEVAVLDDDPDSWEHCSYRLEGFRFSRLGETARLREGGGRWSWQARRGWLDSPRRLDRNGEIHELMAAALVGAGHLDEARALRQDGRRARSSRLARWLMGPLVGHGLRPARLLIPFLVLWAGLTVAVNWAQDSNRFLPSSTVAAASAPVSSSCGDSYPCLQPVVYALETVTPLLSLGQGEFWQPATSSPGGVALASALWVATVAGWLLAALALSALIVNLRGPTRP